MPKRAWGAGRGALIIIALLLIGSALVRFGAGPGAAIALEMKDLPALATPEKKPDPIIEDISPALVALLKETQEKQRALEEKEAALEARFQALALIDTAVQEDLERLEQAEAKLRSTMALADQAAENDLARLTAVYENMKPDQASALFQMMEPSFAAGFLGRMRSDAAAAILAGLEPDLAYSISVVLAGRNADVPREPVPAPPNSAQE
jgi:flagellar motility protein MotE (MotC chaperone)